MTDFVYTDENHDPSSFITGAYYNEDDYSLVLTFDNGTRTQYQNIEPYEWSQYKNASSKGAYWNYEWKGYSDVYPRESLDPADRLVPATQTVSRLLGTEATVDPESVPVFGVAEQFPNAGADFDDYTVKFYAGSEAENLYLTAQVRGTSHTDAIENFLEAAKAVNLNVVELSVVRS